MTPHEAKLLTHLGRLAAEHREATEQLGRPPAAALEALKSTGCLRFFVPSEFGGREGTLPEALRWLCALAQESGSIAWMAMVAMQSPFLLSLFPIDTIRSVYADGPDVLLASSSICAGRGIPVQDGLVVSGVWPLVTGAECCHLFMGHVQLPATGTEPGPIRGVLVRPSLTRSRREDRLLGLVGSNTIHMEVMRHTAYLADTFEVGQATSHFLATQEFRLPIRVHFALHMAAVAVGIAKGAMKWFALEAGPIADPGKRQWEHGTRQTVLGTCTAQVKLQHHALHGIAEQALQAVEGPGSMEKYEQLLVHAAATHISETCLRTVAEMWNHSSSRVLSEHSPFQACLRDLETLTRHANMSRGIFTVLGQHLTGGTVA